MAKKYIRKLHILFSNLIPGDERWSFKANQNFGVKLDSPHVLVWYLMKTLTFHKSPGLINAQDLGSINVVDLVNHGIRTLRTRKGI